MRKYPGVSLSVLIVLFCAVACIAFGADGARETGIVKWDRLFHIAKSSNANVVVYEAGIDWDPSKTAAPKFVAKDPIRVYWIKNTKGGQRANLSWIERTKAYGVKILNCRPTLTEFAVSAMPERIIRVQIRRIGQTYKALPIMKIGGEDCILTEVAVKITGGPFPKPEYADLRGLSLTGKREVTERITG